MLQCREPSIRATAYAAIAVGRSVVACARLAGVLDTAVAHARPHVRLEAQFLRFAAAGLAGTAVLYGVLWIGVSTLSAPAALASAVGYALGSVLSYLLNYFFTFHSDQMHRIAVPRYVAVFGAGWCINTGLMTLFVHHWSWNLWWAQALTTGIGLVWTFAGSRAWTFK